MKKITIISILIVIAVAGFFINSYINKSNISSQSIEKEDNINTVIIEDYKFKPTMLKVKKGTTVTWINKDIAKHNIATDDKNIKGPDGPLISQGQKFTYTFTESGTFEYHCDPHPYMKGEVVVTE